MTDLAKKLSEIYDELSAIIVESTGLATKGRLTLEKKLSYYTRSTILIEESKKILGDLENMIENLDMANANPVQTICVDNFVEILNMNPTFSQTLGIITELDNIFSKITTVEITDNVEEDILYDADDPK